EEMLAYEMSIPRRAARQNLAAAIEPGEPHGYGMLTERTFRSERTGAREGEPVLFAPEPHVVALRSEHPAREAGFVAVEGDDAASNEVAITAQKRPLAGEAPNGFAVEDVRECGHRDLGAAYYSHDGERGCE